MIRITILWFSSVNLESSMSSDEIKSRYLIWELICTTVFWYETQWFYWSDLFSGVNGGLNEKGATYQLSFWNVQHFSPTFKGRTEGDQSFATPKYTFRDIDFRLVVRKHSERTFDPLPLDLPKGSQLPGREQASP